MTRSVSPAALHVPVRNDEASVVVYGIAHGGAGAAPWHAVAKNAPESIEVRGVRLPGREKRRGDPPHTSVAAAAAEVATVIMADTTRHGRPVLVAGVCSGALIGYEALTTLPSAFPVIGVIVLDQSPPCLVAEEQPPVAAMSSAELRTWLCEHDLTAPRVLDDDGLFAALEPTIRADLRMTEDYPATEPRSTADIYLVQTAVRALPDHYVHGWQGATDGSVRIVTTPLSGDPFTSRPDALAAVLAAVAQERPPARSTVG